MKRFSFDLKFKLDFVDSFISCSVFFSCVALAIYYGVEAKWLTMSMFIVCSLNIVSYLQVKSKNKEQKAALDMSDNRHETLMEAFNTTIKWYSEACSERETLKEKLREIKGVAKDEH